MSSHARILLQFDPDNHASSFDAVVAIDAGVEQLLQYPQVQSSDVEGLVHGAMFTRGVDALKNTAIFVGGSNVAASETLAERIANTFFGPVRVSVMLDGNGSNTTAAAAVLCAARHIDLAGASALVLGGTGPVGQRAARLLAGQGASVTITSRDEERGQKAVDAISKKLDSANSGSVSSAVVGDGALMSELLSGKQVLISCGAAGIQLLSEKELQSADQLRVAIDLNAVPPAGLEGIAVTDKAVQRGERFDYGAIGTGGLKMKIHKEAIRTLYSRNDLFLDAEQIFEIGANLESARNI